MPYRPILGTLGYVLAPEGDRVLLIHRTRPEDHAFGKWNGLGGKLEADEDVAAGMCREVREEAGIEVSSLVLRGTVSWPGFGAGGEDWFGFVFLVERWSGTPLAANHEGSLEWVPLGALTSDPPVLDLWPGDRHFLPLVFGEDGRQFHGHMPYAHGQPTSWSYTLL